MKTSILKLEQVSKFFGANKAVNNLNLDVRKGEIFTLLGPSGCGKTTTLRQVAGLEHPDEGKILFHDQVLASPAENIFVAPHKRRMGMVFQSYAIWPHLTVFETVAYPLKARKVPAKEVRNRVMSILDIVGLQGFENRPGPALSGGQQQRVALARALIYEPEILLLDEPFSNLDVKLREQMRIELKLLQRRIGITVILVTHDQLEALSLSDRIAVINDGKLEQIGKPQQLYEQPATPFVRDFIGTSIILPAEVENVNASGEIRIKLLDGVNASLTVRSTRVQEIQVGQRLVVSLRPEDIQINSHELGEENVLEGKIDAVLFSGDRFECHVQLGNTSILIYAPRNQQKIREGDNVRLHFPVEVLSLWPN